MAGSVFLTVGEKGRRTSGWMMISTALCGQMRCVPAVFTGETSVAPFSNAVFRATLSKLTENIRIRRDVN
jgi:hypothetical protein